MSKPSRAQLAGPSLFDLIVDPLDDSYIPDEFPLIASRGIERIAFDTETTGLAWWEEDRIVGASVYDGVKAVYLPIGHRGGNLDRERFREWARRELRNVELLGANIKFDIHMMRAEGIDLEAQGCTAVDVQHMAALLDDHRKRFNLEALSQEFLGEGKEVGLIKQRMAFYHAAQVAEYAKKDVILTYRLYQTFYPMLVEQDLLRVFELECKVIWATCEMEKNGAPIDQELLEKWIGDSQRVYNDLLYAMSREAGFQVDPGKRESLSRLFQKLKLPLVKLESGQTSFTSEIIKAQIENHPIIDKLYRATKIASLRSKYLLKYQKAVDSHGIIRYALHQLRTEKDQSGLYGGDAGTVTGRFSSSEIITGVGVNIQQEMKVAKQRVSFGFEEDDDSHDDEIFVIRRLRVPPKGRLWMAADAEQIEYRFFASYAATPKVIEAYQKNPRMSFHKFMHELLRPYASLTYRQQKDLNFAVLYGAGLLKQSLMLGHIDKKLYTELDRLKRSDPRKYNHPALKPTKEVRKIYHREVPEVKDLLGVASHIAKPECDDYCDKQDKWHATEEHRGYVRTVLGRRSRFPPGYGRFYKSLNSIIQGGAADVAKQKTVELHEARAYTDLTMRYVVHDEVDGDVPDGMDGVESARRISEVLDSQSFPQLKVPILWGVDIGPNWAALKSRDDFAAVEKARLDIGGRGTPGGGVYRQNERKSR